MADSRISVSLDPEIHRRLDEIVAATGKSKSELVRGALAAYFLEHPQPESCLDLASRHDLIGCAKRLPPDLSTKAKYLKGISQ